MNGHKESAGIARLIATINREQTDRIPLNIVPGSYLTQFAKLSVQEFYTDAKKCAQAHIAFYEHFPVDLYSLTGATSSCIAEACGNEVEIPEVPPKRRILEDKGNLAKLNLPDPERDKRLPYCLELYQRVIPHITDAHIRVQTSWPWTVAAQLRGAQELIFDTFDDPDFVHELMKYCTASTMAVCTTINQTLPENIGLWFTEPSAGCSVISPKIYSEFVKPYHEEIMKNLKDQGRYISLHICGFIEPILEDLLSLGVDILDLDTPNSLETVLSQSKDRVAVCGNVATTIFAEGSKADIEHSVIKCLDVGKHYTGYILSPGCALPRNSVLENIKHFADTATLPRSG